MKVYFFVLCVSFSVVALAQNSFQEEMSVDGHRLGEVVVNESGEILLLTYNPPVSLPSPYLVLCPFSANEDTLYSYNLSVAGFSQFFILNKAVFRGSAISVLHHMSGTGSGPSILMLHGDVSTGMFWAKKGDSDNLSIYGTFGVDFLGNLLFVNSREGEAPSYPRKVALYYLDTLGNVLWQRSLEILVPQFSWEFVRPYALEYDEESHTFLLLAGLHKWDELESAEASVVLRLQNNGNPVDVSLFPDVSLEQLFLHNGEIFLLGKIKDDQGSTTNDENALLVSLDEGLDVKWGRVFYGEHFEYASASLIPKEDSIFVLGYSTTGIFPVVLVNLDAEGQILSQQGYPFYNPYVRSMPDGGLLMASQQKIDENGSVLPRVVVAKTDSLGELAACDVYPACLSEVEVAVLQDTFLVALDTVQSSLADVDLIVNNTALFFSPTCQEPPAPSPYFYAPDTLCVGDSLTVSEVNNEGLSLVLWELEGAGVDVAWEDSLVFRHVFSLPGTYILRQTIWYLGCSYSYEQQIVVLPDLEVTIEKDGSVCDSVLSLTLNPNRDITFYSWNTGSQAPVIEIYDSGVYAVTVGDGFCTAYDSSHVFFAHDVILDQDPISLPADTLVCVEHLPFSSVLHSFFTDTIFYNEKPLSDSFFVFEYGGDYVFSVFLEGCEFRDTFVLNVEDCSARIYFPNVFSPNGDGMNDFWMPIGADFYSEELIIFDRWGGEVAHFWGEDVRWDGRGVGSGIYIYLFRYRELLTGEEKWAYGDLLLLK